MVPIKLNSMALPTLKSKEKSGGQFEIYSTLFIDGPMKVEFNLQNKNCPLWLQEGGGKKKHLLIASSNGITNSKI